MQRGFSSKVALPDGAQRDAEAGPRTLAEILSGGAELPVEAALRIFAGARRVVLIVVGRLWSSAACVRYRTCVR
jgi:hypothetical protein